MLEISVSCSKYFSLPTLNFLEDELTWHTALDMYPCILNRNSLAISVLLAAIHSLRLQAAFLEASATGDGSKTLSSNKMSSKIANIKINVSLRACAHTSMILPTESGFEMAIFFDTIKASCHDDGLGTRTMRTAGVN